MEKVLVAYASRHGSTAEVAQTIGDTLRQDGMAVEVLPVEAVTDLNSYGIAVIGSAVQGGKWLPEATRFVEGQRLALSRIPVALFSVCLTMREANDANVLRALSFAAPAAALVSPRDTAAFAGVVSRRSFPPLLRLVMRATKTPEGDFRDWTAIRAWAANLRHSVLWPELASA